MLVRINNYERSNYETSNVVTIYVDEKEVFSVHDGEPEDNNLYRNFSDVLGIPDLMKMAYEAGKAGEAFILEETDINPWED